MPPTRFRIQVIVAGTVLLIATFLAISRSPSVGAASTSKNPAVENATHKVEQGLQGWCKDRRGNGHEYYGVVDPLTDHALVFTIG